jgi:hypothetical protein
MKIRQGFVSNSSSSSFIVKFPRSPKTTTDVSQILFGDDATKYSSPYDDSMWDVEQVAKTVFGDIQSQDVNNVDEAVELLSGSHNCPIKYDDYKKDPNDWNSVDYPAYEEACKKWAVKEFENFYSLKKIRRDKLTQIEGGVNVPGAFIYIFEFSDNDGKYFSALEHGNLFDKVEHIKISQH